jgi:hypothetical protein
MSRNHKSSSEDPLASIAKTLKNAFRPRLYFDIVPDSNNPNLLYAVLGNYGGISAYDINCKFGEDLLYYKDVTLSQLAIFKDLPLNFCKLSASVISLLYFCNLW